MRRMVSIEKLIQPEPEPEALPKPPKLHVMNVIFNQDLINQFISLKNNSNTFVMKTMNLYDIDVYYELMKLKETNQISFIKYVKEK